MHPAKERSPYLQYTVWEKALWQFPYCFHGDTACDRVLSPAGPGSPLGVEKVQAGCIHQLNVDSKRPSVYLTAMVVVRNARRSRHSVATSQSRTFCALAGGKAISRQLAGRC